MTDGGNRGFVAGEDEPRSTSRTRSLLGLE
ncbi:unnamed protein product [Linum tenue]|uniref:Uncharacterized protein n=1 Tax=Linum tenue TaxID=586396 RepID=A0AAV0Q889_9ROSI|nr:unnamed protein product [Linum tenue]